MREIVFDTETTGLDNKADRVIEIGGVELEDKFPTGRTFHVYINPEGREVHPEALAVHGISNADLADKPTFREIAEAFLDFVSGAKLVAHNANFDMGFINAELARLGQPAIGDEWVIDTLDQFNVKGERREDRVGAWVQRGAGREDKIAAIGIRVRHWVTFHGISINVEPDLTHFDGIVPCGIREHGVTSLVDLGLPVTMADLDVALKKSFRGIFGDTT